MTKSVKDSAVLCAARNRIKKGKTYYICYAIEDAYLGTCKQKASLTKWVMHMLDKEVFYEVWLAKHHSNLYIKHRWDTAWKRNARLAWLDWMINYCEERENNSKEIHRHGKAGPTG